MKAGISKRIMIATIALLATCGVARAQDEEGCTNSTLNGDYAFTVSGQIFIPGGPTIQREGVAMTHFYGNGRLSQVDFVLSSPNPLPPPLGTPPINEAGFQYNETGHYTVHADCTGTFTINFPDWVDSATGTATPGAIIVTKFVISNGGRAIHTVVSSITPPGAKGSVPALIRSEGHKL